MNWINLGNGNGRTKMILSDDMQKTGSVVLFDFGTDVDMGALLGIVASMGQAYRYVNFLNPDKVRAMYLGANGAAPTHLDTGGAAESENENDDLFALMSWREWVMYPIVKLHDRLVRWCYPVEDREAEGDK